MPLSANKITPEYCLDVFADWAELPSHLEATPITEEMISPDVVNTLKTAVKAAREEIRSYPTATAKQRRMTGRSLLINFFLSSDGPEARFVAVGLKPVSLQGLAFKKRDVKREANPIPIRMQGIDTIYTQEDFYSHLGFTFGMFKPLQDNAYHSGFLYNRHAVDALKNRYAGIFEKIGLSPSVSSDEFISNVFDTGTHPVAESIVMGYSPLSSLLYCLQQPIDLSMGSTQGHVVAQHLGKHGRADAYWDELESLFTNSQMKLARMLSDKPNLTRSLNLLGTMVTNKDYFYQTERNIKAQNIWKSSGMTDYLYRQREKLYGQPPDEDSSAFM